MSSDISLDISGTDIDIDVDQVGDEDYEIKIHYPDKLTDSIFLGKFELSVLGIKIIKMLGVDST